jgi:hypothetical protein
MAGQVSFIGKSGDIKQLSFSLHEKIWGKGGIVPLIISLGGQLHAPAPLPMEKRPQAYIEEEARRASKLASVFMRKKQALVLAKNQTRVPSQ